MTTTAPALLSPLISAKVLADSMSEEGVRLTTMELVYPRFIHSELMTHRVFSRNASSSRAIPVKRALQMIRDNPAVPSSWRMNQRGMQGYEFAPEETALEAQRIWLEAMEAAIGFAEQMDELKVHKQVVNRICEPFSHIKVVLTSIYWDNWDGLRRHHAADPTICALAAAIHEAREVSEPTTLKLGEWHLPYVTSADRVKAHTKLLGTVPDEELHDAIIALLRKVSTARCARVSYNNHDGTNTGFDKDVELHAMLVESEPKHASPAEHQATPDFRVNNRGMWGFPELHGNLRGWVQYRKTLENENIDTII